MGILFASCPLWRCGMPCSNSKRGSELRLAISMVAMSAPFISCVVLLQTNDHLHYKTREAAVFVSLYVSPLTTKFNTQIITSFYRLLYNIRLLINKDKTIVQYFYTNLE